jgi:hypothetical protein
VNLDEAQRQIGIHTEYSIMSAQRVTLSLEALDEGSGMEMKESRRVPSLFTLSGRGGVLLPLF